MASIRSIKKDIDYLFHEVISDGYLTAYFHPEKKNDVLKILEEAVAARNGFISRANNPKEKDNARLVRKHYTQLRKDMFDGVDELFGKISTLSRQ